MGLMPKSDWSAPRVMRGLSRPIERRRVRIGPIGVGIAVSVVIITAGSLTLHATTRAIERTLRDRLESTLSLQIEMFEMWEEANRRFVRDLASARDVRRNAETLARIAGDSTDLRESLLASPALADLRDSLPDLSGRAWFTGFAVWTTNGVIVAAQSDGVIGARMSAAGEELLAPAFAGETVLTRPYWSGLMVADNSLEPLPAPVIASLSPILSESGEVVAVLQLRMDTSAEFSTLLTAGRSGESGETYLFDRNGLFLSESRFADELREAGLLPEGSTSAALSTEVRDPGGDTTRGYTPSLPVGAMPLTRMAASAISGERGVDLRGYRDYRGVKTVGAWAWLERLGVGIATEMDYDEAMKPLVPGRLAARALFGLLVAVAIGLVGASVLVNTLRRKIDRVRQLGQYTLGDVIGEGGMGVVYHAEHALLRRRTAVKLIKPDKMDPESVHRFQKEVRITAGLTHPNTIAVYDYGRSGEGDFYYAMEYLEGLTLGRLIEIEGRLGPARAVNILAQVCGSLAEAHAAGLVHRDIKPANVFLCERGGIADFVKVLDFGMVKEMDAPGVQVTQDMDVGGTPGYIAPERFGDPRSVDPRLDIYAVGGLAFNMVTGREVFTGSSALEIVTKTVHEDPPRPSEHGAEGIPVALDDLILECLARDPEDRVGSAAALLDRLAGLRLDDSWTQRDARSWWAAHRGEG
jgi:tRNA A-37 threonylcarbamoyl transferase component Bud32